MAKFKPVGARKAAAKRNARGLLPCLLVVIIGFVLLFILFSSMLKSS
jgi:hypothetical protein